MTADCVDARGVARVRVHAVDLINASWGMRSLNEWLAETVLALARELSEQAGMAGDDDAGHAFAKMYMSAARTTVDQLGEAAHAVGSASDALLHNAYEYMATESKIAAEMLEAMGESGAAPTPRNRPQECEPAPRGRGNDLPDAVGETSAVTQFVVGDRFRGSPETLRDVAATWRKAHRISLHVFYDAQDCGRRATEHGDSETMDAIDHFFKKLVGRGSPPSHASDQDTLLANLPAACHQLGASCDLYADHIEDAHRKALTHEANPFHIDNPFDSPVIGGNGYDGGLHDAVTSDNKIMSLAGLGHALDSSQARVKVPRPPGHGQTPGIPSIPLIPVPIPAPVPVPVGYTQPDPHLYRPAVPPPTPPDPRFPPLTPAQRRSFQRWSAGLRDGGFSGGTKAERDYQRRTAGYPEKEVPIDLRKSKKGTLMVDGLRETDGMAVEAKYVKKPGCTFRNLNDLQDPSKFQKDVLHKNDTEELYKYKAAIEYPANAGRLRGVEIDTNDPDAVPYWNALLVAHGVKGYARYVP